MTKITTKLTELRRKIDKADQEYYRLGRSVHWTDAQYDAMKAELRALEPNDELLTRVGGGYSPDGLRTKSEHTIPMGSLDNTNNGIDGLLPWYEDVSKKLGHKPKLMMSYKMDGSSVALYYKHGKLEKAVSRGSGIIGEDITANAVLWIGVPTQLERDIDIVVRGEAILSKEYFDLINEQDEEEEVSNPRNIGNGILGRLDGLNNNYISFFAFNWSCTDEAETMGGGYKLLQSLGFPVVEHHLASDSKQFLAYYESVAEKRDELPFEIDGVVVVIDSLSDQAELITDEKSKLRPKHSRAVKFPVKKSETVITGCNITIGHNGVLCPTATVKRVRVGGVYVSNVNLNNWSADSDWPSAASVGIGDIVEVGLSGDVIPKTLRVVKSATEPISGIKEPRFCPFCGSPTTHELRGKDGAATYCSLYQECPGAKKELVGHWVGDSKRGVGILGIGDEIIAALREAGLVTDPADLYALTEDQLAKVVMSSGVSVGKSRAEKIVKAIDGKRHLSLDTFLGSLGINLLGRRRVEILRKSAVGRLDTLANWVDTDNLNSVLQSLDGVGDITREAIVDGISRMSGLIFKLVSNGCVVEEKTTKPVVQSGGMFTSLSFCFTGTRECIDEVEAAGGIIKSGVSKGLHYLVQKEASSVSNKTAKAEQYGVKIVGIDYLKKALKGEVALP